MPNNIIIPTTPQQLAQASRSNVIIANAILAASTEFLPGAIVTGAETGILSGAIAEATAATGDVVPSSWTASAPGNPVLNRGYVTPNSIAGATGITGSTKKNGAIGIGMMGNYYYSDLNILAGSYTVRGNGTTTTVSYPGIIISTVLMQVSQEKRIVKTPIQGRDGTIKQYIGLGDYKIKCTGIIAAQGQTGGGLQRSSSLATFGQPSIAPKTYTDIGPVNAGTYPINTVNALVQALSSPVALTVKSYYLSKAFAIGNLVVESYNFPQEKGSLSHQAFEITFISDSPVQINLFK